MSKQILILGAGPGGLATANLLRKKLPNEHKIFLIDKKQKQSLGLTYIQVMLGWSKPQDVCRDLNSVNRKNIIFFNSEIKKIDLANQKVSFDSQELSYDYLVVSLGANLSLEEIPGLSTSHYFYDLEPAERLHSVLKNFKGGKIALTIARPPYKCPAAPYEAGLLLDWYFTQKKIRRKVDIKIFTPEPQPMPTGGPAVGEKIKQFLLERNVGFNPNFRLTQVDSGNHKLFFENGATTEYDLLISIPVHKAPEVVKQANLISETGWIAVDKYNLKTNYPNVYAIGDVTSIKLPNGAFLPKAAVFALNQAEVVAHQISSEILGGKKPQQFNGKGYCYLQTEPKKSAAAIGNFYTQPTPQVKLKKSSSAGFRGKLKFERDFYQKLF
ncbi:MAG: FAD-dependent pyridine nucleotide-disulfide oxidoreductase [candidate division Zixibacteria bacterium RBG-1]|nr:MAG: FAD-dependent pyridine nucleotide-disulfide oxidoreductase [candidate division Zixibacteria bacterium RBG-1]OGC86129.1 MAG: hypothetical protein A2V73_04540 [candidate division Zixibacteria bacterium RBG_19FT_COMBO_42_43]